MTVEKIRPRTADEMAATIRTFVCPCTDAYCTRRNEVDLLLAKAKEAELLRDTLAHRTQALQRVIDRPCPHCSATEENP
jgi:hypothetical protein